MPRSYCAVYGCLNSATSRPGLSFFRLPVNPERRSEWLRLISREDLKDRPSQNYTVCEEHFDAIDILPGTQRKKLRNNSLPSLHLPDLQKTYVETSTQAPTLIENCTQTEESAELLTSVCTQTSRSLSLDTPRKSKWKSELLPCTKKIKVYEIDNKTDKHNINVFHELCDKFLTKELAVLVKAQTHLQFNYTGNSYDQNYKMFCLNRLYYNNPQAYRLLQSAIHLPSPRKLIKHGMPVTSAINDRFMSILKTKVDAMNDMEKICSVVIDAMSLKTNLFYKIKQDKIIGFHEVDGVQLPEPAKNAFVVMVRGIFSNWKQPVGFVLLSECGNNVEMAKWIDKLLVQLFEIGLNIKTFVSDMRSDLLNAAKKRSVTIERPYFFVNNKKIYYIFDASHLIKLVRNDLISYDFHFQDRVAKYKHIVQFYENDSQKSFRLAHKLTNSHIRPRNFEKMKVRYAIQLLSNSVAAGISTYVDFNVIEESGRDTAEFIKNMNNLFDALNSSNHNDNEHRRPFCDKESQIAFFNEMLNFFQHLSLINPKNGKNVTSTVKFIFGFQITITSILLLFKDLKSEGCKFLLTRRLNQDVIKNFFGQIRTKIGLATEPTSRQFISAFKKIFYSNIIKPPKAGNCEDDLGKLLLQISALYQMDNETSSNKEKETPTTSNKDAYSIIQIMSSEYNQLDIIERNSLFYVCGYLLKKCAERHDCQIFKTYVKPNQTTYDFSLESNYLRYREYSKDTNQSLLVVPPDDFVQYVEKMDNIFHSCFKREHIDCKIAASIYKELEKIDLILPCPCFPDVYLKKLFIRLRIFYTIKFNNEAFQTCRSRPKYFAVNNLFKKI